MVSLPPAKPKVFANFAPERPDAKVFANFAPTPPAKVTPRVVATFDPRVYQIRLINAGLSPPYAEPEAGPPVTEDVYLLREIRDLLVPDNTQVQYKYVTGQVYNNTGYDYAIPSWCRHIIVTNRSTNPSGGVNSGNLYYFYNNPLNGGHVLPQDYATLTAGQTLTENSNYQWLTLFADPTMTDQGWEIRFEGWLPGAPGGYVYPLSPIQNAIIAPTSVGGGGGAGGGVGTPLQIGLARLPPHSAGGPGPGA
jgi:hypothetical protein